MENKTGQTGGITSEVRPDSEKRREHAKKLLAPEREAKRTELKARLEKRLAGLREKSTNGTITAQETRQLAHGEQVLKRFEQANTPAK